jgi:hypothetical protein
VPISRRDLPVIREALEALYRVLEDPYCDLSGLSTPVEWNPEPPMGLFLGVGEIVPPGVSKSWARPRWWDAYCERALVYRDANARLAGLGRATVDPRGAPPGKWIVLGVVEVVRARLLPSEDIEPPPHLALLYGYIRRGRAGLAVGHVVTESGELIEYPNIINSDLTLKQKTALLGVAERVKSPLTADILANRTAALKFRNMVLEEALKALGEVPTRVRCDSSDRSVSLDGKRLASGLDEDVFAYFVALAERYSNPITFPEMQKMSPDLAGANQSRLKIKIPTKLTALVRTIPNKGHVLLLPD